MAIRGPFVIERVAPLLWEIAGRRWRFKLDFPGAFTARNRKPKPKRRPRAALQSDGGAK